MIDLLKFDNFGDFISKRKLLRVYYILLTLKEKREYKEYIYDLNYKEKILDIIWEFYNEPPMATYYVWDYQLMNLYTMYLRNNKVFDK